MTLQVASVPWFPDLVRMLLEAHIMSGIDVFEWGCGGSTVWFCNHDCNVMSVEHNKAWADRVNSGIYSCDPVVFVPPDDGSLYPDPGDKSIAFHYKSGSTEVGDVRFESYARRIDTCDMFDIVLVDGRARPSCVLHGYTHVKPGGLLVLDNAERKYYRNVWMLLDNWEKVHIVGHGPTLDYMWETMIWRRPK